MKQELKKILIVSRSFYPENSPRAFRTTELVKEFARQGHKVTLLTHKQDDLHSEFEKEHGVTIKDMGPLLFRDIDASKGGGISRLFKKVLRRGLYQLFQYPDIQLMWKVRNALKNEDGYNLLITIAVPHPIHWGTALVWKQNGTIADTWVADCGDPFMFSNLDSFGKMFYFKYFEKAFCRKADYISVPMEAAKEGYYPEFRHKIEAVPQGFRFDEIEIDKEIEPDNDVPTFAYAGGLFPDGRDPRPFLDFLSGLDREYKFIIYTMDKYLVSPYVDKSVGKIELRDYIPRPELLRTLNSMDFLVNFENASSLMMPSKLIDYYLTGRPVLSVKSNTVNSEQLTEFLEGDYNGKHKFDGVDQFRIENVCEQFLTLSARNEIV
jgi:hypothetical protein